MDINGRVELALDYTDRLVSILTIYRPEGWQDLTQRIVKHPPSKGEWQPVLEAVDLILLGIKFDVHIATYVIHTSDAMGFPRVDPPPHFPLPYTRPFGLAGPMIDPLSTIAFTQTPGGCESTVNFLRFLRFFQ